MCPGQTKAGYEWQCFVTSADGFLLEPQRSQALAADSISETLRISLDQLHVYQNFGTVFPAFVGEA